MKAVMMVLIILLTGSGHIAGAENESRVYYYASSDHADQGKLKMEIEQTGHTTTVLFTTATGELEITELDNSSLRINSAVYKQPNGAFFARADYDYVNRRIILSGKINAVYAMEWPVYENNGSLFYIFGQFAFSSENRLKNFHVIQTNMINMTGSLERWFILNCVGPIPVQLAYSEDRIIEWQGKKNRVSVYSLKVNSPALAPFWPHQYVFYYHKTDKRLLQFDGIDNEGKKARFHLVEKDHNVLLNSLSSR